jgi:hypothetical protein
MKVLFFFLFIFVFSCSDEKDKTSIQENYTFYYPESKPLVRWWWHASEFNKDDIIYQLDWLKKNDFGGVEIAWIYPVDRDKNHIKIDWLGQEWQDLTEFTKKYCDEIDLHCDFTFGTLWPFGGTFVPDSLRTKVLNDTAFKQKLRLSWEHPAVGNVIDHLDSVAFNYYASVMGNALLPAFTGNKSALFCDSWEVETRYISTDGFTDTFIKTYGYDLKDYIDSLYEEKNNQIHYDYMKLVSDYVMKNFYQEFHKYANEHNSFTRVQCAGSPTDLITAYSFADVPESEAMLYEPNFSNIVSSAAILNGKKEVSAESFTCLYGFPDTHFGEENPNDIKLIADALFTNGVNQIIWHGMPYNPQNTDSIDFYATVDVGPNSRLSKDLKKLNSYFTLISNFLKNSSPATDVAVYLPLEDAWIAQELPEEKQMKWSWGEYELRYVRFPEYTEGYNPIWINKKFIKESSIENGVLITGDAKINTLVVKSDYLDISTLKAIKEKADEGLKIYFEKRPKQAGKFKSKQFIELLNEIAALDNVYEDYDVAVEKKPYIEGNDIPEHIVRFIDRDIYVFFAHPYAKNLTLPVEYGFSETENIISSEVTVNHLGVSQNVELKFKPYQSLLMKIDDNNKIEFINIDYNND